MNPPKQIHLIFHRGLNVLPKPGRKLIEDPEGILVWKENYRAVVAFKDIKTVERHKDQIVELVKKWLKAIF